MSKSDVRRLGLKLGVDGHKINTAFKNERDNVQDAAFAQFIWRDSQKNPAEAFVNLRNALLSQDVNLPLVAHDTLKCNRLEASCPGNRLFSILSLKFI